MKQSTVMTMEKFSTEERNLLIIQSIDALVHSMAGIFLTVFVFVNSDTQTTILFNLIGFAGLVFWFVLSGVTLKYVSSGSLIKTALLSSALFYLWIFIAKENAITNLIPLALLSGFTMGNYWAAFNLNQYIHTHQKRRVQYFGSGLALMNGAQAIGPLIGGAIIYAGNAYLPFIAHAGYALLFFVVFVILFVMTVLIGKLPTHELVQFSYSQIIHHKRQKHWLLVLAQQATLGLYDVSLGTVLAILTYLILKGEILIGMSQTITFILGSIGSIAASRYLQWNHRLYWIGAVGLCIGILLLALFTNFSGLIAFIVITGITAPFLNAWSSTVYFQSLDKYSGNWNNKYYLMMERDIALGLPRVASYFFLYFFVQLGNQVDLARKWLYVLAIFPLLIGYLLKRYDALSQKTYE